tara:strand:+ start:2553 stop:2753 length:201 start_codon:yes stop_codon:yes gene_type:complete
MDQMADLYIRCMDIQAVYQMQAGGTKENMTKESGKNMIYGRQKAWASLSPNEMQHMKGYSEYCATN